MSRYLSATSWACADANLQSTWQCRGLGRLGPFNSPTVAPTVLMQFNLLHHSQTSHIWNDKLCNLPPLKEAVCFESKLIIALTLEKKKVCPVRRMSKSFSLVHSGYLFKRIGMS